ncbi:MAG: PAS domain S-box protein [Chitinophagaceae bacterium]|nr:PAS domain S-box protein [Oligoflexus sp.]
MTTLYKENEASFENSQTLDALIHNFDHIFDNCRDVMNLFSLSRSLILTTNRAGFEGTGYTLKELQETPIDKLYPPEEMNKLFASFQRLESDGFAQEKLKMFVKNGELRDFWIRSFIVQKEPELLALVHSIDITEEIRNEQKALREARLASLGETTAMLAHELTNAVASIHACLKLIEIDPDCSFSSNGIQRFSHAKASVQLMENIITSIQHYGRLSTNSKSFSSLASIIDESLQLLRGYLDAKKILIFKDFTKDLPFIWVNTSEIGQILLILMKNAAQAMESVPRRELRFSSTLKDGSVQLSVIDSGNGIDKSIQDRIFGSFVSTKPVGAGAGLGLSIAKRLANSNGIKIDFSSEIGLGTTFKLDFQIHDGTVQNLTENETVLPLTSKNILLVGDGTDLIIKIERYLGTRGGKVIRATSAQYALKILGHERINCVICEEDLYPYDEISFIKEARTLFSGVFCAMSSRHNEELFILEKTRKIDFILQKPFALDLLDELLVTKLHEKFHQE